MKAGSLKYLGWILLLYLGCCGAWYQYQHLFFFQPKALNANHLLTFPIRGKFSSAKIPFDANTVIDVVKFEPDSLPAKGIVLFFHGNRYNVEHYSTYAPYFTRHGYACWMVDYPGYGRSTGEMSMNALEQTSIQLYKMAAAQVDPGNIVVYGKSLGTGIASYLASKKVCRNLILETPYYSLSTLAGTYLYWLPVNLLSRYNLESFRYLARVEEPITVLLAGDDELIPTENSLRLLKTAKPGDRYLAVPGARHNTLPDFPQYHQAIDSLLR